MISNLTDYASMKSSKLLRPVLGAETFELDDAYGDAISIQHDLNAILQRTWKITIITDIATLFNVLIHNTTTNEQKFGLERK